MGRRFGPAVSGWLVGFPFTSAPVSVFLVAEQGAPFAASAAVGSIASVAAQAAFALAYVRTRHAGWPAAATAGATAFAAAALALRAIDPPVGAAAAIALAALVVALRLTPAVRPAAAIVPPPRWDLPSRALVATALVVGLTTVAPVLGPLASGILSGFPLYATVLAVFGQRSAGPDAAAAVMRGLVVGLFGFAAFFLVLAVAVVPLGYAAYGVAAVAVIAVQAGSLARLRRERLD